MKKIISIFLCIALLLLSGCTAKAPQSEKLIAVSFYPVYIFTLNVVGDVKGIRIECMAEQNTGCLHDYTVTAKDARLLSDCDVFVVNGAGMEAFVQDLYETVENLNVLDSSEGTSIICSHSHHEEGHTGNHHHRENSHIWMSVDNATIQVENICAGLCELFPQYKEAFRKNTDEYIGRLKSLRAEITAAGNTLSGEKVITFHNAYEYLFSDLGIHIIETIESDEGGEPSAKALGSLADTITAENINALFVEPDYDGSSAEILSNETGARVFVLNPVLKGEKNKTAYEDVMRRNLETILKAVK